MSTNSLSRVAGVVAGGTLAYCAVRSLWRRWSAYDFQDRHVLVTGGSRGLGLVLARQLVREGARVSICARNADELLRAARQLAELGGHTAYPFVCDVTDPEQVQQRVRSLVGTMGPVDVLINNAGIIQVGPLEEMTDDDFQQSLKTHFWGPLYVTRAVLPEMQQRKAGRIVNISSIGGKISVPHLLPYSVGKFALVGFSEGLRTGLAREGITVTTVSPGLMRTGSTGNALFKGQHRDEYTWFSISGSMPLLSINVESAARQILDACRYGTADVTLSVPAKLAVLMHGVAPGLTADVAAIVNRLLPGPGGIGNRSLPGWQSQSEWAPSWLTTLDQEAAVRNNELPG